MTKRYKSKYHITKKLTNIYKNLWGNNNKDFLRSILKVKRKKTTTFAKLFIIKQSLKLFYSNLSEKCFKNYLNISIKSPSKTIDKLISYLERRLDTILFRSLFAFSFFSARQLINHGFVYLNNKVSLISKKSIYKGDVIFIAKTFKSFELFHFFLLNRSLTNYLEIDYKYNSIIFLWDINLANTYFPVKSKYSLINKIYR